MVLLYFIPALRIILGILFIITSALKFPDMKGFARIVASFGIIPRALVKPAAYSLPVIEFTVGWWVLSGKYLVYASIAGIVLMAIADFFVFIALLKKKKMDNCGCYGTSIKVPLTGKKLAENLMWTGLFVMLLLGALEAQALI